MSRAHAARAQRGAGQKIRALPRGYAGTLLLMFYGSMIGVLVVAAGLGALVTEGVKSGVDEPVAAEETEHRRGLAASHGDISITAKHLGNLRVDIEATVTMNEQKRALGGAKVEAFLDMTQMSGAHTQGPLKLRPGAEPGVYRAVTTVSMIGDYEVRVQMHDPVHAEAKKIVSVGVVGPEQ